MKNNILANLNSLYWAKNDLSQSKLYLPKNQQQKSWIKQLNSNKVRETLRKKNTISLFESHNLQQRNGTSCERQKLKKGIDLQTQKIVCQQQIIKTTIVTKQSTNNSRVIIHPVLIQVDFLRLQKFNKNDIKNKTVRLFRHNQDDKKHIISFLKIKPNRIFKQNKQSIKQDISQQKKSSIRYIQQNQGSPIQGSTTQFKNGNSKHFKFDSQKVYQNVTNKSYNNRVKSIIRNRKKSFNNSFDSYRTYYNKTTDVNRRIQVNSTPSVERIKPQRQQQCVIVKSAVIKLLTKRDKTPKKLNTISTNTTKSIKMGKRFKEQQKSVCGWEGLQNGNQLDNIYY